MEWRYVDGFDNKYIVYRDGTIFNTFKNKTVPQRIQSNGKYKCVTLTNINGFNKTMRVHRIVALAFIENKDNKAHVNHKSGDRMDNSVDNLEWMTHSENALHSIHVLGNPKPPLNFLGKFGVSHNKSKSFWIEFIDGSIKFYGSGLEFTRDTGFCSSNISLARQKYKVDKYSIKRGKAKGITVYFSDPNI